MVVSRGGWRARAHRYECENVTVGPLVPTLLQCLHISIQYKSTILSLHLTTVRVVRLPLETPLLPA